MTFHVYPDPQTNPLTVGPGATSAPVPIVELVGVGAGPGGLDTMFLRFVMVGTGCAASVAPDPTLFLVANGTETEITSVNGVDPTPVAGGSAFVTVHPEANDVFRVEIYKFTGATITWQLRLRNNDTAAHEFTWVVADVEAETQQPWIELSHVADWDALTGKTLTGQSPSLVVQVANKGTGNLVLGDTPGQVGTSDFEITAVPGPVVPNACGNLSLQFNAPATPGLSTATFTASTNDSTATTGNPAASHNAQVELSGSRGQLEVVLLLDTSGSMGYQPNGNLPVAVTDTRWAKLKVAAKQFLDLLRDFGDGLGRFGVAVFPDITVPSFPPAPSPSAVVLHGPVAVSDSEIDTAKNLLDAHTPQPKSGATPMGHGIGTTMGTAAGSFGVFDGSPAGVASNERWLLLMSDGAHNSGIHPDQFYRASEGCAGPGSAAPGTSFLDKEIRAVTVAYGDPSVTAFEVDHALLNKIACKSGGVFLDAGADDIGMDLLKSFRTAITAGLALDPTVDPGGTLTAVASEVRREAVVLPFDNKVSFVLNWATERPGRVTLTLVTPTCELITAAEAEADPDIVFHDHPRYVIYTVTHDYLRNAADPDTPRYGVWTLVITAHGLEPEDSEPYEYEVITESRLRMRLETDRTQHFAGDPIQLAATVRLDGAPVPEAGVTCYLDAPGQFALNWLAALPASQEELDAAKEEIDDEEATAIGVKAQALRNRGLSFQPLAATQPRPMSEIEPGRYETTIANTSTPGTYSFHVVALGDAEGVAFRREQRLQVRVGVRPVPEFTILDFVYAQLVDIDRPTLVADVRVWPRDRFGNVVFVDPSIDDTVAIDAEGGRFVGPLTTRSDGSYSRRLALDEQTSPVLSVSVGGEPVVVRRQVPALSSLTFVGHVVEFELGGEAEPGANRHNDPSAILGDPLRAPEEFLALGAAGSVAVAVEGRLIEAQGDDDVTVITPPGAPLHSYRVEAQGGWGRRWKEIGASAGVTRSFSLRTAGLRSASAVRILDTSQRTRNPDLTVSDAPGANLAAVGVRATTEPKGCAWLPGWLDELRQRLWRRDKPGRGGPKNPVPPRGPRR